MPGLQASAAIHADHRAPMRDAGWLLALLAVGVLVAWWTPVPPALRGIAGYPPLHMLLETVAIVIAALIFAIGWNAYSRELPANIVWLACAFLGVALLDFSHALSYAGMPDYVTPSDPEKAIGFWLAARMLAALALLAAAAMPWRPARRPATRYATLAVVLALTVLIHWLLLFHQDRLPRTFVPGSGLTAFKVAFEYTLIALYAAAAAALWRRLRRPQPFNVTALFVSVVTMALSEGFFTFYGSVSDIYNLMGHLYKVVAYLFLYRAIFVETVERPYAQLHAARSRLHTLVQTIPDPLWLKDPDGLLLDCNPAFEKMLGLPREALLGRSEQGLVSDAQLAAAHRQERAAMAAGGPVTVERTMRNGDGEALFEVIKTPLLDARNRVQGLLGLARDITVTRRSEEALRVGEQRLRQAVRAANIGIFDHDHLSDTIYWSAEQRRHYGFGAEEPVTLADFVACVHPGDRERIAAAVVRAHDPAGDGLFDVQHRIVRRDGSVRHLETRSLTLFEGSGAARHKVRTVGAVIDVTERKAAEQALRLRDEALRTSLNAVAMSDQDGRLTYVNDAFVRLWGLRSAAEAVGRSAAAFWQDPDQAGAVVALLKAGAAPWRGEMTGRRADGGLIEVDVWASMAIGEDGKPIGLMASFLDITERRRVRAELERLNATLEARVQERTRELAQRNEELVHAERLAALGRLVAGVAHELNTPIGNAVLVAGTLAARARELASAPGDDGAAARAFARVAQEISDVLERNLGRAAELIGSFKQFAVDQSSHQRRRFELSEVVQEVALALSPTLRRSGVVMADGTPAGLWLDSYPGPLGQVLVNLVNNAMLHAFEGRAAGRLQIGAEAIEGDRVRLSVSDDGVGIPPEHQGKIFDPFFTTRLGQGGSGLGLHIVYSLVTGPLGGRIDVKSVPGAGTTFVIELPLVAPVSAENGSPA